MYICHICIIIHIIITTMAIMISIGPVVVRERGQGESGAGHAEEPHGELLRAPLNSAGALVADKSGRHSWDRCAKQMIFHRLGEKVRPGTFGKTKAG